MATDSTGGLAGQLAGLDASLLGGSNSQSRDPKKVAGKEEFLQLLVTQLKNQDPLNPMENQEFAVQLAQFSQLEQLIGINEKIGGGATGDVSSLAGYLGHEVELNSSTLQFNQGAADSLNINLKNDAANVALELFDKDGNSVGRFDLGARSAGKQTVSLQNLPVNDGEYSYQLLAVGAAGSATKLDARISGVVSGFVPGPDPKLLIGDREVALSEVTQVKLASGQAA